MFVKLDVNKELRGMSVQENNVCQHVSCLKPKTLKTVHIERILDSTTLLFHCFYVNQTQVFDR